MRFGTGTNLLDSSTLSSLGSGETNLMDELAGRKYLAASNDEWMLVDLGSAKLVSMIGIAGHNLTNADSFQIQANSADSWGAPAYDSTAITAYYGTPMIAYPAQTYRYWRIRFNGSVSGTIAEARWAYFGDYTEVAKGIRYGASRQLESTRVISTMPDGSLNRSAGAQNMKTDIEISNLDYSVAYGALMTIGGTDRRLMFCDLTYGLANAQRFYAYGSVSLGSLPHDMPNYTGSISLSITELKVNFVGAI